MAKIMHGGWGQRVMHEQWHIHSVYTWHWQHLMCIILLVSYSNCACVIFYPVAISSAYLCVLEPRWISYIIEYNWWWLSPFSRCCAPIWCCLPHRATYTMRYCIYTDSLMARENVCASCCIRYYLLLLFTDGKGNWVSDGCTNISRNLNTIVCKCNHLSVFGVLVVSTCFARVHRK